MSRKKRAKGKLTGTRPETHGRWRLASLTGAAPLVSAACLLLLVTAAIIGLDSLRDRVQALPENNPEIKVELVVTPEDNWIEVEGWGPRILSAVRVPDNASWTDRDLLENLATQMTDSGWVAKVDAVTRGADGMIRIACDYRRPVAMVLVDGDDIPVEGRRYDEYYIAVDQQGCRLPWVYTRVGDSGWIRIVGAKPGPDSPVPEIGKPFTGDDVVAGIRLASLIFKQNFALKISAIDVTNFRGRRNPRADRILVRPLRGAYFHWGSAIGEEFEEPAVEDKLRLIAKGLEAGWPMDPVDVSVYSNASIERPKRIVRTDGGPPHRGR